MLNEVQSKLNTMFSDLMFDSQRHLYFVNGKRYPSVSSLVDSYVIPFDAKKMLPLSAKKASKERGEIITEEKLAEEWNLTKEQACALGTETHTFMENFEGLQVPMSMSEKAGVKFFKEMSVKYEILRRELRGYSKEFGYAGTQDLPLYNPLTGKYIVADYKTNKDLFKSYSFLKKPFTYLESSPYNKYQIQLSLYQILLEEAGLEIEERWLVYLQRDGEYKIYKLWDFTNELRIDLASKQKMIA